MELLAIVALVGSEGQLAGLEIGGKPYNFDTLNTVKTEHDPPLCHHREAENNPLSNLVKFRCLAALRIGERSLYVQYMYIHSQHPLKLEKPFRAQLADFKEIGQLSLCSY